VVVEKQCATTDQEYEAEFREAIATMVPSFIQLLEDGDEGVRLKAIEVIGELANHGQR
jgi:hypothetical protein